MQKLWTVIICFVSVLIFYNAVKHLSEDAVPYVVFSFDFTFVSQTRLGSTVFSL